MICFQILVKFFARGVTTSARFLTNPLVEILANGNAVLVAFIGQDWLWFLGLTFFVSFSLRYIWLFVMESLSIPPTTVLYCNIPTSVLFCVLSLHGFVTFFCLCVDANQASNLTNSTSTVKIPWPRRQSLNRTLQRL